METLIRWIGSILYNILGVVESVYNLVLSITFLDKILPLMDISIPFWLWFSDKHLKKFFLLKAKNGEIV